MTNEKLPEKNTILIDVLQTCKFILHKSRKQTVCWFIFSGNRDFEETKRFHVINPFLQNSILFNLLHHIESTIRTVNGKSS